MAASWAAFSPAVDACWCPRSVGILRRGPLATILPPPPPPSPVRRAKSAPRAPRPPASTRPFPRPLPPPCRLPMVKRRPLTPRSRPSPRKRPRSGLRLRLRLRLRLAVLAPYRRGRVPLLGNGRGRGCGCGCGCGCGYRRCDHDTYGVWCRYLICHQHPDINNTVLYFNNERVCREPKTRRMTWLTAQLVRLGCFAAGGYRALKVLSRED